MQYKRMAIEAESPEEMGYGNIRFNLAESSVRDIYVKDLGIDLSETFLCYTEHRGDALLRERIVADSAPLNASNVLVMPGAAGALFLIATALLKQGNHLVVLRPNYATNLETPRAIGCDISFIDLSFEKNFQFSVEEIKAAIRPETRLISITTPHNPTGVEYSQSLIKELAELAAEKGIHLLVDETYRDLHLNGEAQPYAASFHPNIISVASLSKAFGAPGIRTGWVISQDSALMDLLLAAKEQMIICGSVLDEKVAEHILAHKAAVLDKTLALAKRNFAFFASWMENNAYLEWVKPSAGVVAFPRIKNAEQYRLEDFHRHLFEKYSTVVGPGHWFEQESRYMRIGFGYPEEAEFQQGLQNLVQALEDLKI